MAATVSLTTQSARLYFIDNTASPKVVRYVDALKDFNGLGGDAKDIDITNQDSAAYEERVKGLIAPSNPSGTIIYNPASTGYQALKRLNEAQINATTQFFYRHNDGTAAPTIVAGVLTPPVSASPKHWTASGFLFSAYVKGIVRKMPTNDAVTADFKCTTSGPIFEVVKGEVATLFH